MPQAPEGPRGGSHRILNTVRCLAPVICLLLAACTVTPLPPSATPSDLPAPSARPTPTPVDTLPPIGPLDENGIPTMLNGAPVHRGADLAVTIKASSDETPFLAGGWFHVDAPIRYCPLSFGDFAVAACPGISLFRDRVDGVPLFLAPGDARNAWSIAFAATRPVVVEIHTHDPRCGANDKGCPSRPILTAIAWLGDAPTDSPPPRPIGSPPPNGLSRDDAVRIAKGLADPHTTVLKVRWAVAGPYWAVPTLGQLLDDNLWVWAMVLEAHFVTPCIEPCSSSGGSELIVIDYVTGRLVETQTPAPPPPGTSP